MEYAHSIKFLNDLEPEGVFTFQTFSDTHTRKDFSLIKILHGTFSEHKIELERLNRLGAGIFVCVNKTDLKGRRRENVIRIRAVFLDLDGAPLPSSWMLQPHMIIETSPGRFHVYWRVGDGFPLDQFEGIQRTIAKMYFGDTSIVDLSRVMRLPGFIHQKAKPFLTRIIQKNQLHPYSYQEILKTFPPIQRKNIPKIEKNMSPLSHKEPRDLIRGGVFEGARNTTLARLAGSFFRNRQVDPKDTREFLLWWSQKRCSPPMNLDEVEKTIQSIAGREIHRRSKGGGE